MSGVARSTAAGAPARVPDEAHRLDDRDRGAVAVVEVFEVYDPSAARRDFREQAHAAACSSRGAGGDAAAARANSSSEASPMPERVTQN